MTRRIVQPSRGFFGEVSEEERHEADLFFEELIGGSSTPIGESIPRRSTGGSTTGGSTTSGSSTSPALPPYSGSGPKSVLGPLLSPSTPEGVWSVPASAHAVFPHRSVGLVHVGPSSAAVAHGTAFVIAPDRILTSADLVTTTSSAGVVSAVSPIVVHLGTDGVSAPAMSVAFTSTDVRWHPSYATSGVRSSLAVLKLSKALPSSFAPFSLVNAGTLPPRLLTIAYHAAGGAGGHQRVHAGNVLSRTHPDLFTMRVFRSPPPPPSPLGPQPFEGGPAFFVGPSGATSGGFDVVGIINDVDPMPNVPASSAERLATATWLTAAKIHWAMTVV